MTSLTDIPLILQWEVGLSSLLGFKGLILKVNVAMYKTSSYYTTEQGHRPKKNKKKKMKNNTNFSQMLQHFQVVHSLGELSLIIINLGTRLDY